MYAKLRMSRMRYNSSRCGKSVLKFLGIIGVVWGIVLVIYGILQFISQSLPFRPIKSIQDDRGQHCLKLVVWNSVPPLLWSLINDQYCSTNNIPDNYAIKTPGCVLPETSLWPDYFKKNWDWKNHPKPDCRNQVKHVTLSADEKVRTVKTATHVKVYHENLLKGSVLSSISS